MLIKNLIKTFSINNNNSKAINFLQKNYKQFHIQISNNAKANNKHQKK